MDFSEFIMNRKIFSKSFFILEKAKTKVIVRSFQRFHKYMRLSSHSNNEQRHCIIEFHKNTNPIDFYFLW